MNRYSARLLRERTESNLSHLAAGIFAGLLIGFGSAAFLPDKPATPDPLADCEWVVPSATEGPANWKSIRWLDDGRACIRTDR